MSADNKEPTQSEIRIRPFPYPYKAGFAFCNDLDCITSFEEMKAIHNVLNGHRNTPCGPGLGLEVSDSFHFYTVHPQQDDTWAYFKDTSFRPAKDVGAMREGIASGLLDTMHTWGNFSQRGGFLREHAARALEELDKHNLRISVWTNHGDIHNFQNLGRSDSLGDVPEHRSVRGDRSEVLEYHLDLAIKAGVRYVWIKELSEIVGQERTLEPADWIEGGVSLGKDMMRTLLKKGGGGKWSSPPQVGNQLLRPKKMRDGTVIFEILRYGTFNQDGADNLPDLITHKMLRRLIETQGVMLFYTHLGKGRVAPDIPFSRESYRALEILAEKFRQGAIWITSSARLCHYIELRNSLKLWLKNDNNKVLVRGIFDSKTELNPPGLEGLTFFYSQAGLKQLQVGEHTYELKENPLDSAGRRSYSVPYKPLEYCWE